jgi:hypothetical protein
LQSTPRHANQNVQLQRNINPTHPQPDFSHQPQPQHIQQHKWHLPVREERESWMPREESLLIEDFDRLFNREEALAEDKPARVREVQRSRRFEKQQLVGRLA